MAQVLAQIKTRRLPPVKAEEPKTEIRADFMTLGGSIILAVTIVVSLVFIFSLATQIVEGLQFVILSILAIACWLYLINRFSERFRLTDGTLEFSASLGRTQRFRLEEITALRLIDFGWTMNGDRFALEIGVDDHEKPLQIGLGPCWRRHELTAFVRTVGRTLEEMPETLSTP